MASPMSLAATPTAADAAWAMLNQPSTQPGSGNRKRKFGQADDGQGSQVGTPSKLPPSMLSSTASALAMAAANAAAVAAEHEEFFTADHVIDKLEEPADDSEDSAEDADMLPPIMTPASTAAAFDRDADFGAPTSTASADGAKRSKFAKRSRMSFAGVPSALRERTNSLVHSGSKRMSNIFRGVSKSSQSLRRSSRQPKAETASRGYFGEPKSQGSKINAHLWSDTVSKEVVAELPKSELDRREAIHELLQGEEDFFKLMDLVVKAYKKPMVSLNVITPAQQKRVFSNLQESLLPLHENLSKSLNTARTPDGICPVGQILSQWLPTCTEAYKEYCANQPKSKYLLSILRRNPNFVNVDRTATDIPLMQKKNLTALLDAPRVRLQNYKMFLRRIFKLTPQDDADYEALGKAIEIAHSVVSEVDQHVALDQHEQILQLQRRLDSAHKTELDFVTEDMQLVLWLKATLKEDKELELYLFTETLIAMRVKKRRADGIVPLVPYGKPIPLGLLQVLDDATEGDKDCHVTLRSAEANFARNGSLRGTLTRRNSVHGKNSFTIKFHCVQDKEEFISAIAALQQRTGFSRSSSMRSVGAESTVSAARHAAAALAEAAVVNEDIAEE